jgi:hypothetical protein
MRDVRNEKRNLSCSVVVLGLALVASTACWAQSSTIGGNPIFQRQGVDSTGGDFFLVDTNNPFTADGDLTNWEIFAGATNPVQLVIYRNIGGEQRRGCQKRSGDTDAWIQPVLSKQPADDQRESWGFRWRAYYIGGGNQQFG